jgi:hypothetical protein
MRWTALALFEARQVPRQVGVDLGAEPLKVEPFTGRICRAHQLDVAALDLAALLGGFSDCWP